MRTVWYWDMWGTLKQGHIWSSITRKVSSPPFLFSTLEHEWPLRSYSLSLLLPLLSLSSLHSVWDSSMGLTGRWHLHASLTTNHSICLEIPHYRLVHFHSSWLKMSTTTSLQYFPNYIFFHLFTEWIAHGGVTMMV